MLFGLGDPGAGALGGRRICVVFDHHVVEPESLVFQAHIFEADTESVERSGVEAEPGIFVEYPAVARGGTPIVPWAPVPPPPPPPAASRWRQRKRMISILRLS